MRCLLSLSLTQLQWTNNIKIYAQLRYNKEKGNKHNKALVIDVVFKKQARHFQQCVLRITYKNNTFPPTCSSNYSNPFTVQVIENCWFN